MNTLEFGGSSDKLKRIELLEDTVQKQSRAIESLKNDFGTMDKSLQRMHGKIDDRLQTVAYFEEVLRGHFKTLDEYVRKEITLQNARLDDTRADHSKDFSYLDKKMFKIMSDASRDQERNMGYFTEINKKIAVLQASKKSDTGQSGTPLYTSPPALTVTDCPNSPNPL